MTMRRPTAKDRNLAEHIRNLPLGEHRIDVYLYPSVGPGGWHRMGDDEAREGQLSLNIYGPKRIDIYPVRGNSET